MPCPRIVPSFNSEARLEKVQFGGFGSDRIRGPRGAWCHSLTNGRLAGYEVARLCGLVGNGQVQ